MCRATQQPILPPEGPIIFLCFWCTRRLVVMEYFLILPNTARSLFLSPYIRLFISAAPKLLQHKTREMPTLPHSKRERKREKWLNYLRKHFTSRHNFGKIFAKVFQRLLAKLIYLIVAAWLPS